MNFAKKVFFLGYFMLSLMLASTSGFAQRGSVTQDEPLVKFSVSVRDSEPDAHASVTFEADGFFKLDATGWVKVNGQGLAGKPFGKQGHWYVGRIPLADRYLLEYAMSSKDPIEKVAIVSRKFVPNLPESVSRSGGLTVPFEGPPLSAGERIFAELASRKKGAARWGVPLETKVEAGKIFIPPGSFIKAGADEGEVYVGITSRVEPAAPRINTTYAIGRGQSVKISP